ncbi:MAG: transposase family protein [Proteobacteria bacterium]|nr:transposase family protein [Pseudomonadota bacterium]
MDQIYDIWNKTFLRVPNHKGIILHSDQRWQYQHYGYQRMLKVHGIVQSMSGMGNCLDNAVAENFFGII